jgi:diadenosine tetraphosphate (Ap4A) HIT family hydrolase
VPHVHVHLIPRRRAIVSASLTSTIAPVRKFFTRRWRRPVSSKSL